MKDKKIKPDNSQFVIDLAKDRIICNYCKGWYSLSHPQLTPEQIKGNFKIKHKSCK